MKPLAKIIFFACFAARSAFAEDPAKPIQDLILDDHTVYSVPVSGGRVTTVSFPSAISAIDAALVTTDGKNAGLFQIAHTDGTSYFSVRALAKGAATNLNVRWDGRTYVLELKESADPCLSVISQPRDEKAAMQQPLTPASTADGQRASIRSVPAERKTSATFYFFNRKNALVLVPMSKVTEWK